MKKLINFFKKHVLLSNILIAVVASLLVLFIAIGSLKMFTHHGEAVEVPDLMGKKLSDILANDDYDMFEMVVVDSVYSKEEKGSIVSQDPSPGSKVKKGRKIYLCTVAVGERMLLMPDLIDLTRRQAATILESIGLQLGEVKVVPSQYAGAVIEQQYKGRPIAKGTEIPYGSSITLLVGSGEEDLVGDGEDGEGEEEDDFGGFDE